MYKTHGGIYWSHFKQYRSIPNGPFKCKSLYYLWWPRYAGIQQIAKSNRNVCNIRNRTVEQIYWTYAKQNFEKNSNCGSVNNVRRENVMTNSNRCALYSWRNRKCALRRRRKPRHYRKLRYSNRVKTYDNTSNVNRLLAILEKVFALRRNNI